MLFHLLSDYSFIFFKEFIHFMFFFICIRLFIIFLYYSDQVVLYPHLKLVLSGFFLTFSHFLRGIVLSLYCSNLQFPNSDIFKHFFIWLFIVCTSCLVKQSIKNFHPFSFFLVLEIRPLSKLVVFLFLSFPLKKKIILLISSLTCFPNIFSILWLDFHFSNTVCHSAEIFILIKSNSFFLLMDHTFDIVFINVLAYLRSLRVFPAFL